MSLFAMFPEASEASSGYRTLWFTTLNIDMAPQREPVDRFDLEFFGVTLTTHGASYLGLIMRPGGV